MTIAAQGPSQTDRGRALFAAGDAAAQSRATLNALTYVAGQRPEEIQGPRPYQQIERVIVYPPSEPGGPEIVRRY